MPIEKVGLHKIINTKSFNIDNFARRVLKKTAEAVDINADELQSVVERTSPMTLWGTYTLPANTIIKAEGLTKADFTPVDENIPFEHAKGIMVVCNEFPNNNWNMQYKAFDAEGNELITMDDTNTDVKIEVFKAVKELSGEIVCSLSYRRTLTSSSYYYNNERHCVGFNDGNVAGEVDINDFNVKSRISNRSSSEPLTFKVYARF